MLDLDKLNDEQRTWIESRPPLVRDILNRYPPGKYRIKEGAPYRVTCAGCVVGLQSVFEDGKVAVVILEASPASQFANDMLNAEHKPASPPKTPVGLQGSVDPRWLELIEVDEQVRHAWSEENDK